MAESFSHLPLDCSPFIETDQCLFSRLAAEETSEDVGSQTCNACGARVCDIEQQVGDALAEVTIDHYEDETALSRAMENLGTFSDALMTPDDALRVGTQIGEYILGKLIGRGSMGTVYEAHDATGESQSVAIKLLEFPGDRNSVNVKRFQREFDALCGIRHANIVQAMSSGATDNCRFFVMELLDGIDVAQIVAQFQKLPVATACEIARQAAIGTHALHRHGLLHRDIKPSNLMLLPGESGSGHPQLTVKVLDLGLTKAIDPNDVTHELTPDGATLGTYAYMSPEQLNDPRNVGVASDVYSLGAVLWRMVTGQQYAPVLHRVEPSDGQPDELVAIFAQALHSDAGQRFSTASEFADALSPLANNANFASVLAAFRAVSE